LGYYKKNSDKIKLIVVTIASLSPHFQLTMEHSLNQVLRDAEIGIDENESSSNSGSAIEKKKRKRDRFRQVNSDIFHRVRSNQRLMKCFDVILSQVVRLAFMIEAGFCIYLMAKLMNNNWYYLIFIIIVVIIIDGLYIVTFRAGKEYTW
jgi:hypothetical protein